MAFEGFDKFQGFLNEDPLVEARGSDVGLGDYILDVPKGVLKGGSQAIQGLLQLGALPIDYLADTNLLTNIENLFEKITPETKNCCWRYYLCINSIWCTRICCCKNSRRSI